MESDTVISGMFQLQYYSLNTLIIGSGTAALKAAVSLHALGQHDIAVATEKWGAGTSNNAGSDKQTYYKLSLSGHEPDSVTEMAKDLFNGRCMHGDIALCEAQGSVQSFMKLADMGVPFPRDKFGSWPGYKTDHDPRARATSAGPFTSKIMFNVLAEEVRGRKIKVLDSHQVIAILTDRERSKAIGALAVNTSCNDPYKSFVIFNAVNIITGTGGPAGIYETSVYPHSQNGATGMAFAAGASGQNLTESQFGIASTKFRWNLSGSYQQVIPRYFSTDINGDGEKEFLTDHFPDYKSITRAIFLKGYQWPFDPEKADGYGSSLIDLLVFRERAERGRRVFVDFTRNLSFRGNDAFHTAGLDDIVYDYLSRSGALQPTPLERLMTMNEQAAALYIDNGIDIRKEPVEVAVCAQHNNGGLTGNIWWESDLKHLFPVGEVNGSHGVRRPGGAALNSGQVGGYRAAWFIAKRYTGEPPRKDSFLDITGYEVARILRSASYWLTNGKKSDLNSYNNEIRKRMSDAGSIIRDKGSVARAAAEAELMLATLEKKLSASSVEAVSACYRLLDNCLTHYVYLESIKHYIEQGGRSRGSYLISGGNCNEGGIFPDCIAGNLCRYDRDIEKKIVMTRIEDGIVKHHLEDVREVPVQDLWFEKVWRDYLEDNLRES